MLIQVKPLLIQILLMYKEIVYECIVLHYT